MSRALSFWKMAGAGNDFIVLDGRAASRRPLAELAQRLCPRRTAVGADGMLAVGPRTGGGIEVEYVNADGSPAEFCGNGARCAARFALLRGMGRSPFVLAFPAQEVRAEVRDADVEIETSRPRVLGAVDWTLADGLSVEASRVDAGVEHAVVTGAAAGRPLDELRVALERERPGLSSRINITIVRPGGAGRLLVRTHERGSGETLACGSGALAAVVLEEGAERGLRRVVVPPAGIPLEVTLEPAPGPARLAGEARLVYEGVVEVP